MFIRSPPMQSKVIRLELVRKKGADFRIDRWLDRQPTTNNFVDIPQS